MASNSVREKLGVPTPCICDQRAGIQCLWHYGEAKRDARRSRERPYRKERRGRKPRQSD